MLKFQPTEGQTDLHVIALGSYEGTGPNRNFDSFSEQDCIKNAHWFRDSGKFDKKTGKWDGRSVHRHHRNKPDSPKYGNIKDAAYNLPMKRIELIIGLDNTKCADILDEQEKKGFTCWSMASKQAFDICEWCKHKSYNGKTDRCTCIENNLGEINKQGQTCHMRNPNPHWFEHSYVGRNADRIGLSLGVLNKEGSYKVAAPKNYLDIYPDFYVPAAEDMVVISKKAQEKRGLLHKLAAIEKHVDAISKGVIEGSNDTFLKERAEKLNASDTLSASTLDELRKQQPGKLLRVLADNGIVFGPDDFAKFLFADRVAPDRVKGMKEHLPDIFSCLEDDDDGEAVNMENFEPEHGNLPAGVKELLQGLTHDHSIFERPARMRVMKITIIGKPTKPLASAKPVEDRTKEAFDKGLAQVYAGYKLAALNYLDEQGKLDEETMLNAVIQNRQ